MATPAPLSRPKTPPVSLASAPTVKREAVPQPEDSQPAGLIERSPSSWPAPASDEEGAGLINAGGPPSTRYRLIAPRQGKRVPRA
ncbi:MAG: hypothetical protein ABI193_16585 [Minicystis sp.]